MEKSIVYTNDSCIGCNKCIKVCSAIGACISKEEDGHARIEVDGSKCVACGSCIDVCVHGAREFTDDTERFFRDLKNGESISLLLAPAFKANYPEEYDSVLGGLKALGVNRIISVSFGADITTWGYLKYIQENDFVGGISQPCPAVVSYIERYLPELIDKLFPVQSPLMCAAIYARKALGIQDKFAFISPCIAKKLEIEDPHNDGLVQYNVTFEHLMQYVREHNITGPSEHSEVEYGLGAFYPTPGGLAENVRWFLGDQVYIRQIEGERHLYEWMHINADRIRDNKTPFLFIDALNCEKGCICGTAVNPEKSKTDDALYALLDIREAVKKEESGAPWSRTDTPAQRLEKYNEQFKHLNLSDYIRGYTDRSAGCRYGYPNAEQLEEIFVSMNKTTEESRNIDCTCCGYENCKQMATAIYNGFNRKENCIYYEKTMVHNLEVEKHIAEEASRAKDVFLANMSHELRTPINAVLGMNEMILRESGDKAIQSYSRHIKAEGNKLLGFVDSLLEYTKKQEVITWDELGDEATKNAETSDIQQEVKHHYTEKLFAPEASVLVIDDTPMNLVVFQNLMKYTQMHIDTADSGDAGLALMRKNKYDIIFFDHMMPEKDGIATLHELRAEEDNPNRHTTAVCLSANAIPGAREFYLSSGFDDYMSKPIDAEKIEALLLTYLPLEKVKKAILETEESGAEEVPAQLVPLKESAVDIPAGIKNSGSTDAYIPLLKIFYESMDAVAAELSGYFENNDLMNYTIKIHALKSSARLIGAIDLGEKAQALENAGKEENTDFIRENWPPFLEEYMLLKEPLSQVFATEEVEKTMADDDLMQDVFTEMRACAESMDIDSLEAILDEMKHYSIPENVADKYDRVVKCIQNFDYDGVLTTLNEL